MDTNPIGFLPALLPVALAPGASFTLAINSALAGGRRGLISTLTGTALGIYTHALLIGLGVTAVLVASPVMFTILQLIGTFYLLWLGIQLIRSGLSTYAPAQAQAQAATPVTLKEAWLANVLNPKAILFYLTVVSRFAGQQGDIGDYLMLASLHVLVMVVWLLAVSRALIFSARKLDPLLLKKWVNIAGGLLLIACVCNSLLP